MGVMNLIRGAGQARGAGGRLLNQAVQGAGQAVQGAGPALNRAGAGALSATRSASIGGSLVGGAIGAAIGSPLGLAGAGAGAGLGAMVGAATGGAVMSGVRGAGKRAASGIGNAWNRAGEAATAWGGQAKAAWSQGVAMGANPPGTALMPPDMARQIQSRAGMYDTVTTAGGGVRNVQTGRVTGGATGKGGATVDSNSPIPAGAGGDWSPLALGGAMAGIGGAVSYATGGNFVQGALLGAAGGFGIGKGASAFGSSTIGAEGTMLGGARQAVGAYMSGSAEAGRYAMLGGAGLSGMVFGGRRNHRRGFNSRRGSRI